MDKYPLPAYAVSMWVVGDNLMIAFPGVNTEKGHTIKLPASAGGLATAIGILRERQSATNLRIAQRGTPTQYEVENDARYKALCKARSEDKKATKAERDEAIAFLEELGL